MFVGNPWMRFNTFFRLKSMETKVQVHVKLQGPIYNGTLETFTWTKVLPSCFRLEKCLFLCVYLLFLHCFIAQVTFVEKQKMKKKNSLKKQKYWCLIHAWSDKGFKGTVLNQVLPSLHRWSLEITVTTVPDSALILNRCHAWR